MPTGDYSIQSQIMVEIRSTVSRHGPPNLVPHQERYGHKGFTSMYGYGPEAVQHIRRNSTTAGLDGFALYSDTLYVDFDDKPEEARAMIEALAGYQFQVYDSGGRSIHLHIPIKPMYGPAVARSQKAWMEENYPEADLSIYRPGGIYRLPGTYHHKNPGRRKALVSSHEGDIMSIPMKTAPSIVSGAGVPEEDKDYNRILGSLLDVVVHEGTVGRNPHLFKIAKVCSKMGQSYEEAKSLLEIWNEVHCRPSLGPMDIDKVLRSAYRTYKND